MFAGKKSAQIREILISESAWEEMTCLFAPSLYTVACRHISAPLFALPSGSIACRATTLYGLRSLRYSPCP
ncbi:hypothetical protein EE088_16775 [Klebsiella pneumoniae]|nr:hypothetical protein [Klebsiella pneumoniae]